MIARQLCRLVAQCRACLEADCSYALVRQRDLAFKRHQKEERNRLPVKRRQVSPTAHAVPYKGWQTRDGRCHLPSTSEEAKGDCVEQEEPVDEHQENEYPYPRRHIQQRQEEMSPYHQ